MAIINATIKGRIEDTSALSRPHPDDGPFVTADGKYAFITITIDGTYSTTATERIALVHSGASDLERKFGIKWVKALINSRGTSSSIVTGKCGAVWTESIQRLILSALGNVGGATGPIAETEVTNSTDLTTTKAVKLDCLVVGD